MLCIKCGKETPDAELYCRNCGAKLDLTFDQVTDKLGKDISGEKVAETESFFRWLLILTIFFTFSGWLFNRFWTVDITPQLTPCYLPNLADIEKDWTEIQVPLVIQEQ